MDRYSISVLLKMTLLSYTEYLILKLSFSISKGYFYAQIQDSSVAMVQTTDKLLFCCAS